MFLKTLCAGAALAALALAQPVSAAEQFVYPVGSVVGQHLLDEPDVSILYIGFDRPNDIASFALKTKVCGTHLPPDNLSFDFKVGQERTFVVKTDCESKCRNYTLTLRFDRWATMYENGVVLDEEIKVVPAALN